MLQINQQTMSSIEVVALINQVRKEEGNNTELRHSHFLEKVPQVLINSAEFSAQYKDSTGRTLPSYNFPKRECMLMAMSYSYSTQARLYDRWQELENQQTKPKELSRKDLALMVIQAEEEKEKLELKLKLLTHQSKLFTATEIAKECGLRSAQALNEKLLELKVQYSVNGTWVLSARYSELGYVSIKQQELDSGRVIYDRKFTQSGREFVLNLLGE